jgi:hypothetical protein
MIQLRDYQKVASRKLTKLCQIKKCAYLSGECRTGKTMVALSVVRNMALEKVLVITKKKAIPSIESDIRKMNLEKVVSVTNFEMLKRFRGSSWNMIIVDEAHSVGAFPKPSQRYLNILKLRYNSIILMSGTPSPESFSQLYHQWSLTPFLWSKYQNFYRWASDYVNVKEKRVGTGIVIKDYSDAKQNRILKDIEPYTVQMTQKEAGFTQEVEEEVHMVKMSRRTYRLALRIIKDGVIGSPTGRSVVADTGAKVMSKLRQIYNGHVITERHGAIVFDKSKADYIKDNFSGRIAILYCFIAEGKMLREYFGDRATDDPDIFNAVSNSVFIGQVKSCREGVNLSSADHLIFLGIDYSALSYLQGRERASFLGRDRKNKIHYIFAEKGIEPKVYDVVKLKESYTINHYRNDRGSISEEADRQARERRVDSDKTCFVQQSWFT